MLVRSNDLFPMLFNNVFNNINDAWNQNFPRDPQINISESKLNFKIEFCVPGLSKEDLNLTIDTDNNLVISMERKPKETKAAENAENTEGVKVEKPKDKEEYNFLRHDFHIPHFKEAIALPDNIHKASRRPSPCRTTSTRTRLPPRLRMVSSASFSRRLPPRSRPSWLRLFILNKQQTPSNPPHPLYPPNSGGRIPA